MSCLNFPVRGVPMLRRCRQTTILRRSIQERQSGLRKTSKYTRKSINKELRPTVPGSHIGAAYHSCCTRCTIPRGSFDKLPNCLLVTDLSADQPPLPWTKGNEYANTCALVEVAMHRVSQHACHATACARRCQLGEYRPDAAFLPMPLPNYVRELVR